jgi:hypothetical protein
MVAAATTIVDSIYREYQEVHNYLSASGEISHAQVVMDAFRRNLVVSAASLFEQLIKDAIMDFSNHRTGDDPAIACLVRIALVERGFHQMFSWKDSSPNSFFAYFGDPLGSSMRKTCSDNPELKLAAKRFLELGELRNSMVHSNFAMFSFENTPEEAFAKYRQAKIFVDYVVCQLAKPQ